ncbi:MAG: alpha/beta fold hydrolase [Chitinophagaceae bacterium]|nr:MAG: alpha/beta fold hydrolase [Chitinophagaceae bacterium]
MRILVTVLLLALFHAPVGAQRPYGDSILRRLRLPDGPVALLSVWDTVQYEASFREVRFEVTPGDSAVATLVMGAGMPPRKPLVLFQHWGGGNRHYFDAEMAALARRGFLCLSLDAPWHWPTADTTADPLREYPDHIQRSVRAVTRFLDWAGRQRGLVDIDRIYFVGHSYGATLGGLLLPAEPRIRAAVLMAGLPSLSRSMEEDPLGAWKTAKQNKRGMYDTALHRLSLMEPERLIHLSPAAVFYQAATGDQYVPRRYSEEYIKAASPVKTAWYATDHLFVSDSAQRDRLAWILRQDSLTAADARTARRLLERAATAMGSTDAARWARQEWAGKAEYFGARGQVRQWREHWWLRLPDSVGVGSFHTTVHQPPHPDLELTPLEGYRVAGDTRERLDSTAFDTERRFYQLCWLSLCSPALAPGVQVQLPRLKSKASLAVRVLQRPGPPVVIYIDEASGLPTALGSEDRRGDLLLRLDGYAPAAGGLRPKRLRLYRNEGMELLRTLRLDTIVLR